MNLLDWILLLIAVAGLVASWHEKSQERKQRAFEAERGKYGSL
jgi:hypothetical protein